MKLLSLLVLSLGALSVSAQAVGLPGETACARHDLSLDANAFAPGVYVVHMRVWPESGATWTEVRRITVAR